MQLRPSFRQIRESLRPVNSDLTAAAMSNLYPLPEQAAPDEAVAPKQEFFEVLAGVARFESFDNSTARQRN